MVIQVQDLDTATKDSRDSEVIRGMGSITEDRGKEDMDTIGTGDTAIREDHGTGDQDIMGTDTMEDMAIMAEDGKAGQVFKYEYDT
ncbi:hypothetical protein J7E38_05910 [Bacillus sp. ISL-35]|uniref:hypothetical protein n=1 Tax=Bacillus sp. ISL-35 TaxID=2819122 RepID=UPI001BE95D38|nr:hypothetical protein [Bacillus sp. ISL-35]MBT2678529.1 hypothetical protein [Bacillus sp. ISL-35]MBT2705834.1 hypothetical protein [Chryseobacterium sp. ISL-80]